MESWGIGTDVGGTSALLGAPGVCGVGDRRWHGTGCRVRRASQGSSPSPAGASRRRHGIEAAKGWECRHGQGETGQKPQTLAALPPGTSMHRPSPSPVWGRSLPGEARRAKQLSPGVEPGGGLLRNEKVRMCLLIFIK